MLHQIGAATIHVCAVFPFIIFLDREVAVQIYRNTIKLATIVSRVECPMITKSFHICFLRGCSGCFPLLEGHSTRMAQAVNIFFSIIFVLHPN
ncbi:hypothetical protein QE345_gp092 [Pseudomonas phage vB_PA45_GUMS]|uniref:Uncharacterized protein n=1 Tax=Pseudomonas phage vB_PA45_GUMS TaxID=2656517 RepID=A0A8T8BGB3_9CAUD|nr:hypothetical protein QE345_gp092 [Pseudomonas phage vB_PA45_GUMS]QGK90297.1 hypothetical protein [Pseudomonas phage vB_PA45_GUMS]